MPLQAVSAAAAIDGTGTASGTANPVRTSRSRRPKTGTSTVSTSAEKPAASARSTKLQVTSRRR